MIGTEPIWRKAKEFISTVQDYENTSGAEGSLL